MTHNSVRISDIVFIKPQFTLKETSAIITVEIPITKRQDAYDFAERVKHLGDLVSKSI